MTNKENLLTGLIQAKAIAELLAVQTDGDQIVWANPDGSITPVRQIFIDGGDR